MKFKKCNCDWCKAQHVMRKIKEIIDNMPEFELPIFDDAIADVYNAADDAGHLFDCGHEESEK
jgi:hypothetical protein